MQSLDVFFPVSVLEKICSDVNRALYACGKPRVNVVELRGIIALHILAASYGSCVTTITANANQEFFYQLGIEAARYKDVWYALS